MLRYSLGEQVHVCPRRRLFTLFRQFCGNPGRSLHTACAPTTPGDQPVNRHGRCSYGYPLPCFVVCVVRTISRSSTWCKGALFLRSRIMFSYVSNWPTSRDVSVSSVICRVTISDCAGVISEYSKYSRCDLHAIESEP